MRIALFLIFEMILKHSNIGGRRNKRKFNKEISFEITRQLIGDNIKVDLIVFDKKSTFLGETTNLLSDMRRDFFKLLVGICDFKIQFNTAENDNYECQILPYSKETRLIKEEISGFKYIFLFTISMKKILIIDDNIDRWSAKISPFVNNVSLTQDPSEFFDYDKAGNFCNLKFEKNDYEYVFIHHSQSGDSLLPSSLIDLIKNHLGLNLILFSGNIEQSFENKERENFHFRSLRRTAMQDNIVFFIKESLKDGDYWI